MRLIAAAEKDREFKLKKMVLERRSKEVHALQRELET